MRPEISVDKEFDRIVLPFNFHRLLIIIASFSFLYAFLFTYSQYHEFFSFDHRGYVQMILAALVYPIISALTIFCYYTIYDRFKNPTDEFEKMLARGFKILVIALVLDQILIGFNYLDFYFYIKLTDVFNNEGIISFYLYINSVFGGLEIVISLVALYGFYLVGTSLNHYERKDISTRAVRSGRWTSHPKPVPDVLFPMDPTRMVIMAVCLAPPIVIGLILAVNYSFYEETIFEVKNSNLNMFLLDQVFIKACISFLTVLIILKISRYFSYFSGEFERRVSFGFLILLIATLLIKLNYFIQTAFFSQFISYIIENYQDSFMNILNWYIISYYTTNIIISLVILYGLIVVVSSLDHYKSKTQGRVGTRFGRRWGSRERTSTGMTHRDVVMGTLERRKS